MKTKFFTKDYDSEKFEKVSRIRMNSKSQKAVGKTWEIRKFSA